MGGGETLRRDFVIYSDCDFELDAKVLEAEYSDRYIELELKREGARVA